ncbi:MAG: chemotaxis protein CheC [Bacilli bacterium]
MTHKPLQFSPMHLDVLKEIGNIGSGHAATALSALLQKKIDMSVPDVRFVPFNEIVSVIGGAENVVAVVALRIEGDAPGMMFFIMSVEQATYFLHTLFQDDSISVLDAAHSPLIHSAVSEIGNILSGSYLSALANLTGLNLQPSVPYMALDMAGALIGEGLLPYSIFGECALLIDTVLIEESSIGREEMQGHFFLIPDPDSFNKIFNALGVS